MRGLFTQVPCALYVCVRSVTFPPSLPLSLTHSLTHSLTNSLTHSLTHSLIHSLMHRDRQEATATLGELLARDPYADDDAPDVDGPDARPLPIAPLPTPSFSPSAAASATASATATGGPTKRRGEQDWRDAFRPIRIDPLPPRGAFDVRAVRESDYFFD
jgi:DNA-directed RNA polymerase